MFRDEVVLPQVEHGENLAYVRINKAVIEIGCELREAVWFIEKNQNTKAPVLDINDYFRALSDYFETRDSLIASMLETLFRNHKIFDSGFKGDALLEKYGSHIGHIIYNRAVVQRDLNETYVAVLWSLCSPITVIGSLAIIANECKESVSKQLVKKLQMITSAAFNVDTKTKNVKLSDLMLLKPLVRQIELYERTKTLLACIETIRGLTKSESSFDMFSFSEELQHIGDFSYLTHLRDAFTFGINNSDEFIVVQNELHKHSGNIIVQDQIFLKYVADKFELTVKNLYDLSQKIKAAEGENEVKGYLGVHQNQITYMFALIVLLGKNVYTIDSMYQLFNKEFSVLLDKISGDPLLPNLCTVLLPFISTSIEESTKGAGSEKYLKSMKDIFQFLQKSSGLPTQSALRCLLDIHSPLRFYRITELLDVKYVQSDLKPILEGVEQSNHNSNAIMDYWLLKKEDNYIDTLVKVLLNDKD